MIQYLINLNIKTNKMKKTQLLLLAVIVTATLFTQKVGATIWRVNNKSNYNGTTLYGDNLGGTAAYPVFNQIQQAHDFTIVNAGDTIYVEGSIATYLPATITKKLVIIGTGYFLTNNSKTSSNKVESAVERIYFNTGSEGSQLIGLDVVYNNNYNDQIVYVNVNDITIKRCRIEKAVQFGDTLKNVFILENFFPNVQPTTNVFFTNSSNTFVPPVDIIFNNNICQKTLVWNNGTTLWPITQCNNNVFDGPDNLATPNLEFATSDFKNNILMATNAMVNIAAADSVIAYNIGTQSTQFGTNNNNLVVPNITSLYVTSTSPDGTYQIATTSAAYHSGSDGADRGAFGGVAVTDRYTLSGLAAIPVIYSITTTGATAGNLPVTIQARTIK